MTNYFSYILRFNGVSSRNKLPRIKDRGYVINIDDKNSNGTRWVSQYINRNIDLYFGSFGIEYIPQEVLNKVRGQLITQHI